MKYIQWWLINIIVNLQIEQMIIFYKIVSHYIRKGFIKEKRSNSNSDNQSKIIYFLVYHMMKLQKIFKQLNHLIDWKLKEMKNQKINLILILISIVHLSIYQKMLLYFNQNHISKNWNPLNQKRQSMVWHNRHIERFWMI